MRKLHMWCCSNHVLQLLRLYWVNSYISVMNESLDFLSPTIISSNNCVTNRYKWKWIYFENLLENYIFATTKNRNVYYSHLFDIYIKHVKNQHKYDQQLNICNMVLIELSERFKNSINLTVNVFFRLLSHIHVLYYFRGLNYRFFF